MTAGTHGFRGNGIHAVWMPFSVSRRPRNRRIRQSASHDSPPVTAVSAGILFCLLLCAAAPLAAQSTPINEAFVTTGPGEWLEVGDTPDIAIPVFTLECWIRVESSGLIVTRDDEAGTPSDWQLWYEDRRLAFITARTPPDSYFYTPRGSITPGQWHHIALQVHGTDGWAELYIDGVTVIRPEFSSRQFNARTGLAWGGYFGNASGSYLAGAIDEGRYWNHIRAIDDIRGTMNRRLRIDERDGLVGYWSFCGNFADSSGHGHDLRAYGVLRPEDVTGLPLALSCDAPAVDPPAISWRAPAFPPNPCLRDSLALAEVTVFNDAETPRSIERLILLGDHAGDFSILTDPTPLLLMPGDSAAIRLGFRPGDHGTRRATLLLVLADTTIRIEVVASYDGPLVELEGLPLRFHSIDGAAVTEVVRVLNRSTQRTATITDVQIAPSAHLSLETPLPLAIPPASARELVIRYQPAVFGSLQATIAIVIDGCAYTSDITAQGCPPLQSGELLAGDAQGSPGDTVLIPLLLRSAGGFFGLDGGIIHGSLRIDCHALYPLFGDGGRWDARVRTVPLAVQVSGMQDSLAQSGLNTDTAALLPFLVLLGTDSLCALEWRVDSVSSLCPVTLAGSGSAFTVYGFCEEGDRRLFDGSARLALTVPFPNPANGSVVLRYATIETGEIRLLLFDALGRRVATLFQGNRPAGSHSATVETDALSSGRYFIILSTPHQQRTTQFVVVK